MQSFMITLQSLICADLVGLVPCAVDEDHPLQGKRPWLQALCFIWGPQLRVLCGVCGALNFLTFQPLNAGFVKVTWPAVSPVVQTLHHVLNWDSPWTRKHQHHLERGWRNNTDSEWNTIKQNKTTVQNTDVFKICCFYSVVIYIWLSLGRTEKVIQLDGEKKNVKKLKTQDYSNK